MAEANNRDEIAGGGGEFLSGDVQVHVTSSTLSCSGRTVGVWAGQHELCTFHVAARIELPGGGHGESRSVHNLLPRTWKIMRDMARGTRRLARTLEDADIA